MKHEPSAQAAPDGGRRRSCRDQVRDVEIRPQHDDHADEADRHRRPAIDVDPLVEKQRGQRHGEQGRGEADRGRIHERQAGERREIEEHADDGDQAAAEMTQRAGLVRTTVSQFAPPGIVDDDRDDAGDAAKEDRLPDRHARAQPPDRRRHGGEQKHGDELEQDGVEDVHGDFTGAGTSCRIPCHSTIGPMNGAVVCNPCRAAVDRASGDRALFGQFAAWRRPTARLRAAVLSA